MPLGFLVLLPVQKQHVVALVPTLSLLVGGSLFFISRLLIQLQHRQGLHRQVRYRLALEVQGVLEAALLVEQVAEASPDLLRPDAASHSADLRLALE